MTPSVEEKESVQSFPNVADSSESNNSSEGGDEVEACDV